MNKPYKIEYSVGFENFQHDTKKSSEEMIQKADAAMYKHKKRQ
jgi:GGDEF domain-containing protein